MLRAAVLVFVTGWIAWFWLDKPPLPPAMQGAEYPLIANFQFAFSLLKKGYFSEAYAFIWRAHYVLLSLLGGLLASMATAGVSRLFTQRRNRVRIRRHTAKQETASRPPKPDFPASDQDL